MKQIVKNKKGITLSSLIVYITIMLVIIAVLMRVMMNFRKNVDNIADTSFETQQEKLNMYLSEETKTEGNEILEYTQNSIRFTDGNRLTFIDEDNDGVGQIYYNKIKICDNVSSCEFTAEKDTDLNIVTITVNYTINDIQQEKQYVIKNSTKLQSYIRIPSQYVEVEYIESTGTQFINSGYYASGKSRIYADFQYTEATIQGRVFGTRLDEGENYLTYDAYINGNGYYAWACQDGVGNWKSTNKTATTARVQVDFNSYENIITYSGGITYSENIQTTRKTINKNPIHIFSSFYNGATCNFGKLKLYSLFIENNGIRVRDFVPCYRKSDGAVGLYDLVEDKFYTSGGTGELLKGDPVSFEDAYQEVEYIESTGTQYIDLGIIATNDYGAEIEYAFTSTSSSDSGRLFGTRNGDSGTGAFAFISSWSGNANSNIYIASNNTATTQTAPNIDLNWHNISCNVLNDKKVYYDENLLFTGNNTQFTADSQASLFRIYNKTSYGEPSKAKVRSLKIYNNGELIRDYKPCFRKTDGEIGLYDIINNKFYANTGTGELLKGDKIITKNENIQRESDYVSKTRIPKEYQEVQYIEGTGAQYINTMYNLSPKSRIYADFAYTQSVLQTRVFGVQGKAGVSLMTFEIYINGNGQYAWACQNNAGNWKSTSLTANDSRVQVDFNSNNNRITFSGGITYTEEIKTTRTITNNAPVYIFATNLYGTSVSNMAKLKIYSLFIENNGIRVRDFVPCYRVDDGIAGLYDLVNGVFYTNQGTGYFLRGPEIYE